jgi:hypothetical protein
MTDDKVYFVTAGDIFVAAINTPVAHEAARIANLLFRDRVPAPTEDEVWTEFHRQFIEGLPPSKGLPDLRPQRPRYNEWVIGDGGAHEEHSGEELRRQHKWAEMLAPMKHPRITCPVCGKEVGVNNGRVMYHKWRIQGRSVPCSGVGRNVPTAEGEQPSP